MIQQPKHVVITDPREYDGNPYEVAERAFLQAQGVAQLLYLTVEYAKLMARNAEMEREMALGGEPNAAAFPKSAQGVKLSTLSKQVRSIDKTLEALRRAAAYDPMHPPKEQQ